MSSILGTASMNIGWAVLYAFCAGLGFTLVMIIMSGMREKLNNIKVAKSLAGFPVSMVTAAFICMAFTVFTYIA
jgi:electron transport complex protein RnfA